MRVTEIDHVVFNVTDAEKSVAWWHDLLGLEAERLDEWRRGEVPFVSVRINEGTILDLFVRERTGENVDHMAIRVSDVDLDELATSGTFDVVRGPLDLFGRAARAAASTCATPTATSSSCAPTLPEPTARGIVMDTFTGKLAVVTGGGTGMGRELTRQLAAEGCHVAICDVSDTNMADTLAACEHEAPAGTRVSSFVADVSKEADLVAFRDHVLATHDTDHIDLLFNNAGIGGGGSVLERHPRGVGAGVQRVLGRRLLRRADVPAAARQEPRRGASSTRAASTASGRRSGRRRRTPRTARRSSP